jgi:dihydropteroate synthase
MAGDTLEWPTGKLDFSQGTVVMGILNVTPDSFSDGGAYLDARKAIAQGLQLAAQGAAILDVGAESSRPGAEPVSPSEQIKRVVPVIEALTPQVNVPISIDTYDPEVAHAALQAGASMINDITALVDNRMAELVARHRVPVILMHMQGMPQTMQNKPSYANVVDEVLDFLTDRAEKAEHFGIAHNHIIIDPGIGFGKTLEHNLELLRHTKKMVKTGYRVLVGTSRKGMLGQLTGKTNPAQRGYGTAATVAHCVAQGVSIVRVHDVEDMLDVVTVMNAIRNE